MNANKRKIESPVIRAYSRNWRMRFLLLAMLTPGFACSNRIDSPVSNMAAAREAKREIAELRDDIRNVEPFFAPMGKARPDDWLGSHVEPGQTFDEYLDSKPTKPTKQRQTIYVLPLGDFTPEQKKVIEVAAAYLNVFFDLPVTELPAQPLTVARNNSRQTGSIKNRQIRTGYVLNEILQPLLPEDASALIAFTSHDLYPDESMNYVFGQASIENRVGMWSLNRLDDNARYDVFLRRSLKIAAHETGHMFSMRHCTKYECVMSGTNHLAETDRRPIDACPECMAKIAWLSDINPTERYRRLADFCRKTGMISEAEEFTKKAAVLGQNRGR